MKPNWPTKKLGEVIIEIEDGGTPSTKVLEYFNGDIPWVNIEDIKPEIWDTRRHLSKLGVENSSAKLWPKGTVIFSFGASIGKVGIAMTELCTKQGIAGIVPDIKKIPNKFLYYSLLQESPRIREIGRGMGSTVKEVRPSKLVTLIKILLPPLPTQQKIVQVLDTIQEAVEAQEKIIGLAKELKKSLMEKLFREGAPSFKRGRKLKKTEIGEIPGDWEVKRLGDKDLRIEIIDSDRGVNYPKQHEFFEHGYCLFLNTKNVPGEKFDFSENYFISKEKDEILGSGKLQIFDIVFTTRGTVGNIAYYDEHIPFENIRINSGMVILRNHNKDIDNLFLCKLLRGPVFQNQIKKYISGSAQQQLPIGIFKKLFVIRPSFPEQREIAEILQIVDQKIEIEQKKKAFYDELFRTMLNKIMKQEIDIEGLEL